MHRKRRRPRNQSQREGTGEEKPGTVRYWREREQPEPTNVWQTVGIVFLGFAFATGIGALTIPNGMAVRPSELTISAVAFAALATACFLADWDVNRGRRSKRYETEELPARDD